MYAGEVLLSPEVISSIGNVCEFAPAADGHALLLSVHATAAPDGGSRTAALHSNMAPNVKAVKQKAGQELMALHAQGQLQAVKVVFHPDCCQVSAASHDKHVYYI
jgi:hypothetical protein